MTKKRLIVDGHVHIYDCYNLEKFFNAAENNMNSFYSQTYQDDVEFYKILLLTEAKQNDFFTHFINKASSGDNTTSGFRKTGEDCSLAHIDKEGNISCFIMPGRQIVTKEKLEILSVASAEKIEDGLPTEEVVSLLIKQQKIAVLAWGVGKWFGKRGEMVENIIKKYNSPYLFIGDNSARPTFWPIPNLYNLASKYGAGIISGSDPLPFSDEASRVGSYGFFIEGDFDTEKPAASFINMLLSSNESYRFFGKRDSLSLFLNRQGRMFYRKQVAGK